MTLWKLDVNVVEYRSLVQSASIVKDSHTILADFFVSADSVVANWETPRVEYLAGEDDEGACKIEGDYPSLIGALCPVFTQKSMAVLGDLLSPFGEFLPLASNDGTFNAFKVLKIIDALDEDKSEIRWHAQTKQSKQAGERRWVDIIQRYAFHENLVRDAVIFRIPQLPFFDVFVTDIFVN
jgi:hypothetical protein